MANHPNRSKAKRGIPPSSPTPDQVREMRAASGLTQTEAAGLVYSTLKTWQRWEASEGEDYARSMPVAARELFLLKLMWKGVELPPAFLEHIARLHQL